MRYWRLQSLSRRLLHMLCVWCGLSFLWACGGNISNKKFHSGTGSITGTLLLPDGAPAARAQVQIVNLPKLRAVTDEKGQFSIKDVPAGRRELMALHQQHGARLEVWVIGGRVIQLTETQAVLAETGQISGHVEALHRFGAKGIKIAIKGTPHYVLSSQHNGAFTLPHVPKGCHTLFVTTPMFMDAKRAEICIEAGQRLSLQKAITMEPAQTCTSTCGDGAFCRDGYCVPDEGGEIKTSDELQIKVGEIFIKDHQTQQIELLKNTGPGRLHIKDIRFQKGDAIFSVRLPTLPLVLESGKALGLEIDIAAEELGSHQMVIEVDSNDQAHPVLRKILRAEIKGYSSDCLVPQQTSIELETLALSESRRFQLEIFNRCETDQHISVPEDAKGFPTEAGFTPIQLQTTIPAGKTVKLAFDLLPQAYGELRGDIQLQSGKAMLYVPVSGFVAPPGDKTPVLSLRRRVLDFGLVAPGEQRTLWLHLQFATPPSAEELKELKASTFQIYSTGLKTETKSPFSVSTDLLARSVLAGNQAHYMAVRYTAPMSGSLQKAWLKLSGVPGLGGRDYMLPIQGNIASLGMPIAPTDIHVGAVQQCTSKAQTIQLSNPGDEEVIVQGVSLEGATGKDFLLAKESFPLRIPAHSKKIIGKIQFSSKVSIRSFAQLRIQVKKSGATLPPYIVGLRASSGFPRTESYTQADGKRARVLFYLDPGIERIPAMYSTFITVLSELQVRGIDFEIATLSKQNKVGAITPSTIDGIQQLLALLGLSADDGQRGFEQMLQMWQSSSEVQKATPTAIIYITQKDDRSGYSLRRYLPHDMKAPFAVFGAISKGGCEGGGSAQRYLSMIEQTQGASIDVCTADKLAWEAWGKQIRAFLLGERRTSVLSSVPKSSTLELQINGHRLTSSEWSYSDSKNQLTLQTLLPPGQTLQVSYYNHCE